MGRSVSKRCVPEKSVAPWTQDKQIPDWIHILFSFFFLILTIWNFSISKITSRHTVSPYGLTLQNKWKSLFYVCNVGCGTFKFSILIIQTQMICEYLNRSLFQNYEHSHRRQRTLAVYNGRNAMKTHTWVTNTYQIPNCDLVGAKSLKWLSLLTRV